MNQDWPFEMLEEPKKPLKEWSKLELRLELHSLEAHLGDLVLKVDELREWGKMLAEEYNKRPKEDWET